MPAGKGRLHFLSPALSVTKWTNGVRVTSSISYMADNFGFIFRFDFCSWILLIQISNQAKKEKRFRFCVRLRNNYRKGYMLFLFWFPKKNYSGALGSADPVSFKTHKNLILYTMLLKCLWSSCVQSLFIHNDTSTHEGWSVH